MATPLIPSRRRLLTIRAVTMSSREPQAQLFTPAPLSDNPKMWAGDLGLLYPSQSTVQFKDLAALTAFLKTLGVDVDMNLTRKWSE